MPLLFEKGDITKLRVDAIVNAANSSLLGGGGVDGCIHRAAGPELLEECITLNGCATGDAKITKGYKLPAKHVIHTVGPVWRGGDFGEKEDLESCYRRSLEIAKKNGCQTVAFPLISAGAYGYPVDEAKNVAINTITNFLEKLGDEDQDMFVTLVFYDGPTFDTRDEKRFLKELQSRVGKTYDFSVSASLISNACLVDENFYEKPDFEKEFHEYKKSLSRSKAKKPAKKPVKYDKCDEESITLNEGVRESREYSGKLYDFLKQFKEETFSEMLLRLISERNMSNSKCYNKANVTKQVFSKIISNDKYHPKKPVVCAFAVALNLNLDESKKLLQSLGLAFSPNERFDLIVQYFIEHRVYDVLKINEYLCEFGEPLLGSGLIKEKDY